MACCLFGRTKLRFICAGEGEKDFVTNLGAFAEECSRHSWTVRHLLGALRDLRPEDDDAGHCSRVVMVFRCNWRSTSIISAAP